MRQRTISSTGQCPVSNDTVLLIHTQRVSNLHSFKSKSVTADYYHTYHSKTNLLLLVDIDLCQLLSIIVATRYYSATLLSLFCILTANEALILAVAVLPSVRALLYSLPHCFSCSPGRPVVRPVCTPYVQMITPGTKDPIILSSCCYSFNPP
jgi:hypothetical protein